MKNIKNDLMRYINIGDYMYAKEISFYVMTQKYFYNLIIELGFETESIALYTFISFLLMEQETAHMHQLAAVLISQALSHIEGAYSSGLLHARKAAVLEPNDLSYKEYLLLFNTIPEKLLNDSEAKDIAREILKQDPTNAIALNVLEITGKHYV